MVSTALGRDLHCFSVASTSSSSEFDIASIRSDSMIGASDGSRFVRLRFG